MKFNLKINAFLAPMFLVLSSVGIISLTVPAVIAQKNQYLGQARLSPQETNLEYLRFSTCQTPPLQQIKLVAKKGMAKIDRLVVQYGNNQTEKLQIRNNLNVGMESRWIDLKGGKRCVKAIALVGSSDRENRNSVIQFYGR
jgi:Protein of unknown function (DUF2541)